MIFKLLRIRKNIREAKHNPGGFVGGEVVDVALGFLVIPLVIAFFVIALFFLLGFTGLLGGPFGFFKVLFVLSVFVGVTLFAVLRPLVGLIRRRTTRVVNDGVKRVKNEFE